MIRPPPTSTLFPYPTLFRSVPPAVDEDLQVREDLEITDAPRLDPTGIQSGRQVSLGRAPRADQPAAGGPFDRVHELGVHQPATSARRGHDAVWSVDLEMRAFKARVGLADRRWHLLRMQRGYVVVLLEGIGEDLPIAVVVSDEIVTLGELFERVVVKSRDHRAEEFAQALARFAVEVDEDEPVPDV